MSVATAEIVDMGLGQVSKAMPKETAIRTNARSILEAFASVKDNSQTRLLVKLALGQGSYQEYDLTEKEAAKMADEIDKASGFVKDEKRRYGPKRNSLNTQASERRQVFGAIRQGGLETIVSIPESGIVNYDTLPAWQGALASARAYLKQNGVDWQGEKSDDKRKHREQKADSRAWQQARAMAEAQNPQQAGETYAMWQARVTEAMQDIRAELDDKARTEILSKKAKELFAEFGSMGAVELAEMLLKLANPGEPAPM